MKKTSEFTIAMKQEHLVLALGLGLLIVLAGGGSLTRALMMTLALSLNLLLTTTIIFLIKRFLSQETKWFVTLIVMASVATLVQMLAVAFLPGWVQGLEAYLPLIAISGMILARLETVVQFGSLKDVMLNSLGSIVSFAILVLPIGLLADFLGLGVVQLATWTVDNPQTYFFTLTILPTTLRIPFFAGTYGSIGLLILTALVIALFRRQRRQG